MGICIMLCFIYHSLTLLCVYLSQTETLKLSKGLQFVSHFKPWVALDLPALISSFLFT